METIGTVEEIRRYPVKSMRGEELAQAFVQFSGLMGDRVWAFVQSEKAGNFPWHSAREQEDLLLYVPKFRTQPDPDKTYPDQAAFSLTVQTPGGQEFAIDDPALLAEISAKATGPVHLRFSEKGMQDARPISLFGRRTVDQLSEEVGIPLDERRFRANFYVRWRDDRPFVEDELVGRSLRIGEKLELQIVKKDPRCKIITLDPETAAAEPGVLRTVAKRHGGFCGVYGAVLREGLVHRGDVISLI